MVVRLIEWSLRNRMLVLLTACLVAVWGATSARHMALDAIPDLSDVQVIIQTPYAGQSPQT
ncbi:MAG: efflux RND transporter permease subunit, partial [Thiobacillus sp.]|nr:efflux RND transporter permease subunit [Thiobacillus sp.]